ncbi:hypothetical protein HGRIS_004099 [Hohenbuehelia grisea]|uniref:coproporphyrinogen oxidase n=1 Tax=Hohenbuehelia grisea TaxID=104357 RepID=A0ABR3JHU3_9AGAR
MATSKPMRQQVEEYINALQDTIVGAFEELDPNAPKFRRDSWVRAQGGTGRSCVFAVPPPSNTSSSAPSTTILEKGGVNISIVHGTLPPAAIKQMRADHAGIPDLPAGDGGLPFFAAGLSLVVHPRNPHAPTVHLNYRYFEITRAPAADASSDAQPEVLAWWFGGGSDLTPSYLYEEDAKHFHSTLKTACDAHGAALFPAMKTWCDEYFAIPHRGERRGLGGIFFDDLTDAPHKRLDPSGATAHSSRPSTPESIFALVRQLGDAFVPSYIPILAKRANTAYTPEQRRWQLLRRGRYVEFNLVYDRGTKFGLATPGARIESILMSLPEEARWEYESDMGAAGTEEGRLMEVLRDPKDWA